jgi:hypothetical protein
LRGANCAARIKRRDLRGAVAVNRHISLGPACLPRCSLARGFFSSEVLQLLESHFLLGNNRRTCRIAHLLLVLVGFCADLVFAEAPPLLRKVLAKVPFCSKTFFLGSQDPPSALRHLFFPSLQADVVTVPLGDSTTHGAEYCSFPLVTMAVGVSAFIPVRA